MGVCIHVSMYVCMYVCVCGFVCVRVRNEGMLLYVELFVHWLSKIGFFFYDDDDYYHNYEP